MNSKIPSPDPSGTVVRGILHVHSRYSYDGNHSLQEIAQAAREAALSFVCITEHSDTLDSRQVSDLVTECESLSSADFVMIPGIEFTCRDSLHLLGIGVRSYDPSPDSVYLSRFIREGGGVSVLAHPMRKAYRIPEGLLDAVDGIEIWNCNYDGSVVPNARAIDLYVRARSTHPSLVAFVGCDLHRLANIRKMAAQGRVPSLDRDSILNALRAGAFRGVSRFCSISGRPSGNPAHRIGFRALQMAYSTAQRLRARLSSGGSARR
jgi:hypothetical protein